MTCTTPEQTQLPQQSAAPCNKKKMNSNVKRKQHTSAKRQRALLQKKIYEEERNLKDRLLQLCSIPVKGGYFDESEMWKKI